MSKYNASRPLKLEIDEGMLPVKELLVNDKTVSAVNWEMEGGIVPVRALPSRTKASSCDKSPISLGIVGPFVESPPS